MAETHCLFKGKRSRCKSSARKDLPLMICEGHLRQYFGLEVGNELIDDLNQVGLVGGFLKPVKNNIFKRNHVIVPTKYFFDLVYRNEDMATTDIQLTSTYTMSTPIEEAVRDYATKYPNSIDHRHVIEMYRNFINKENVDPGQNQKDEYRKLQALVEINKAESEVYIRSQPVGKTLQDNQIYLGDTPKTITEAIGADRKIWSPHFQYFMNNCLFSEMEIQKNSNKYTSCLPFNVKFEDKVGLVATEQIGDPLYLVVDGRTIGSQIYYNAHVSIGQKVIQVPNHSLKDFPEQYALNIAIKEGTNC